MTYQGFAATWPSVSDEAGFADRMNSLPKYVVSTTLEEPLEWNRHPEVVRKLVVTSVYYNNDGIYPEVLESIEHITPEAFAGSTLRDEYDRIAPNPEDFPTLVAKLKELDLTFVGWPLEDIQGIEAPTLVIIGDSDVVRPEHAVEMFRLLGGGVAGDLAGLPGSQLAVLPGTTRVTLVNRAGWLLSMITAFLDAPMPEAE